MEILIAVFWIAIWGVLKYLPLPMEAGPVRPREFARHEEHIIVGSLRAVNVCFSRIYHHLRVATPCTLPRRGPAILVSNHISALDPVMIQSACPRLIRWMMAAEYYNQKSLRWLLDSVGTIPVERSGRDMAATRAALRALEMGYVVGVFAEGRIETTPELIPFQQGIVLLAARSEAPICPAYIEGSQRNRDMLPAYLSPQRATLRFGPTLKLHHDDAHRDKIDGAAARIQAAVETLRLAHLRSDYPQVIPRLSTGSRLNTVL